MVKFYFRQLDSENPRCFYFTKRNYYNVLIIKTSQFGGLHRNVPGPFAGQARVTGARHRRPRSGSSFLAAY